MKRTLTALTAAAALALATTVAPNRAEASVAWWWIPVAVVGGVVIGSMIAHPRAYAHSPYAYEPRAFAPRAYHGPRAQAPRAQAPRAHAQRYARSPAPRAQARIAAAPQAQVGCRLEYRPGLFGGQRLAEVCS